MFNNKIVILGYGQVAQSLHRLILKEQIVDNENIFVIEKDELKLQTFLSQRGIIDNFIIEDVDQPNFKDIFTKMLNIGDILIDLSYKTMNINSIKWCFEHNVLYLSSSDSSWVNASLPTAYDCFLKYRELKSIYQKGYPTCLIEFGMNPGLVSLFVKRCLTNIVLDDENFFIKFRRKKLLKLLGENKFNVIAKIIGLKNIIVSDIDNSYTDECFDDNVLYNTWNAYSLYDEFFSNAEICIGTKFNINLLKNQIIGYSRTDGYCMLKKRGIDVMYKTWSPIGNYEGCLTTHEEVYSIGRWLSIQNKTSTKYKPTIFFSYKPCEFAYKSLKKIQENQYVKPTKTKIISKIQYGGEAVGVILCGKHFKTRYFGNYLDINASHKTSIYETPTILQVSSSLVSGLKWIIENPMNGLTFPEELPTDFIFPIILKYLKTFIYKEIDYKFKLSDFIIS